MSEKSPEITDVNFSPLETQSTPESRRLGRTRLALMGVALAGAGLASAYLNVDAGSAILTTFTATVAAAVSAEKVQDFIDDQIQKGKESVQSVKTGAKDFSESLKIGLKTSLENLHQKMYEAKVKSQARQAEKIYQKNPEIAQITDNYITGIEAENNRLKKQLADLKKAKNPQQPPSQKK